MATENELVERVRRRAYEIWEREGRLDGYHERHWHQAAKELESQSGVGAAASDRSGNGSVRNKKAASELRPSARR
ncbi:DUF2934 domain-containing protein [Sinorhizobium americanum]|uniref:Cell division protein FtsW n=1 Tax=Sinorhizobium americanum TaxID=194963 RepID=A0A1L3LYJ3_9HYPH|nr:DUF2934 domain-containing protein [Sinorhizobium americanum]APG95106.1 cell division protein FtsW [Sinorhizobium americanum]